MSSAQTNVQLRDPRPGEAEPPPRRRLAAEPLDQTRFLGVGRSLDFPFPQ